MAAGHVPNLSVLFLSGERNERDGSRIYRCGYQARQIEQGGGRAEVAFVGGYSPRQLRDADVVVLSRCPWEAHALRAIHEARAHNKLVLGDLDDRIYAPWDAANTGYLRSKSLQGADPGALDRLADTHHAILRLLPAFDAVLTSTATIRDDLFELGLRAQLAPNAIDCAEHAPIARPRGPLQRILFMTGTRTHDADFRLAASGVARFLHEQPSVTLRVLGPVDVPAGLASLPNVRRIAKLPMAELYPFIAQHDVCLVPLEPTRFNDCKSALKFIECGLVSVPVVASARHAFAHAITHQQNGWLVDDPAEPIGAQPDPWYQALRTLHETPSLLRKLASEAHDEVLRAHTVQSRGAALLESLELLLDDRRSNPLMPRRMGARP